MRIIRQRNRVSRIDDIVPIEVGRACYEVRAAVGVGPDVWSIEVPTLVGALFAPV